MGALDVLCIAIVNNYFLGLVGKDEEDKIREILLEKLEGSLDE